MKSESLSNINVLIALFISLIGLIFVYLFTPVLAWGFSGLFFYIFLIGGIVYFLNEKYGISIFGILLITIFISFVSSCEMGRSDSYRDLIGKKNQGTFNQEVAPIDPSQIRIVDRETATQIADKLMGEDLALGSRAHLGPMSIQNVGGKIYWVAPILHSRFFAWFKHSNGTPGYIKVSATNPNDYEFVQKLNGSPINIKYQSEAYFSYDIERHLWLNGFMTRGTTDYTFEIDDNGKPYYVVTVYKNTIGFSGADATGVVTVDVETGDINEYSLDSIPEWVDRVQPDDLIYDQLVWWGEYQNGWFNPGGEGKLKPTHEMLFVHGKDGKGYWYTTITSKGKDESISGFVMIDSKTKKFTFYSLSGATDISATNSILGRVKEKGYTASPAILYNIAGRATYVVSLKDSAGVVKAIGLADVENHSVTGIGNNIRDALRDYASNQNNRANSNLPDSNTTKTIVSGVVSRISSDIRGGNSYYYFRINEVNDQEFVLDSTVSTSIVTTKVGDLVEFTYNTSSETGTIQVVSFDNKNMPLKKGAIQIQMENNDKAVRTNISQKSDAKQADDSWNSLTSEEKSKILQKMQQ
jgi:hypothetical protein